MAQPIIPSPFQSIIHPPGAHPVAGPKAAPKINFATGAGESYAGDQKNSPAFRAGQQHGAQLAVQHHTAAQAPRRSPAAPVRQTRTTQTVQKVAPQNTLNGILAQAQALARADTQAQVQAIQQQQDLYNTQALQRANQIRTAAQGAAQFVTGIGDNTASSYNDAAKLLAGIAGGYSGQLGQDATAEAQAAQSQLAGLGAPAGSLKTSTGQTLQPAALSNVLYGLGGVLPANLLVQSGQAQAAAQRQLPATTLGSGEQQALGALASGQQNAANLIPQILSAQAGQPKLVQQYLQSIASQIQNQQLAQSLIGSRAAGTKISAFNAQTSRINATTAKTRAANAAANTAAKTANPSISTGVSDHAKDGLAHDAHGNLVLGPNGKPIPWKQTTSSTSGTNAFKQSHHGLDQKTYGKFQAEASGYATAYHAGRDPKTGAKVAPLTWTQYLGKGRRSGLPTWLLVQVGRNVYTQAERTNDTTPGA